ncbi:hypothetical protein MKW94_018133 [Papaver nudicaule]|uniref:Uncharacterized protein n=1 Tax=Papaver nudicaule TaxID=74823 RepID=A0AA41W0B9_PAPNU|nr:hypothetical protein [Papaver nudicaule]
MDDYGEKDRLSSLDIEYKKAVQETMELIEEARKTLDSDWLSTFSAGSPLGNITLWRILFESSVAGLRLDLISKKHGEAIKLGVGLLEESRHATAVCLLVDKYLNELHAKISLLLSDGNRVLLDFVAMHRTVAEITYMLGDVFTTGGAGMKDLRDETSAPGSSSRVRNEETEMDIILNFPWDKHNVPPTEEFDRTKKFDPDMMILCDPIVIHRYNDHFIL